MPTAERADSPVPASLRAFDICIFDGKVVKGVPKRLRPLQGSSGGVLGGKALVAWHLSSGLAVAMATDPDGDTNEAKLVPDLLPQVRALFPSVLWLGDRQFGDPTQTAAFTAREGDHSCSATTARRRLVAIRSGPCGGAWTVRGGSYEEDWGTFGGPRNKHRRCVRRITLYRPGEETVVLITDLLDAERYPATDLLALYLARWGIERVFQQITEVFNLQSTDRHDAEGDALSVGVLFAVVQPDPGGASVCGGGCSSGRWRACRRSCCSRTCSGN